ncbi:MAG: transketolase [Hungatella hathewayi]|nr:transketolase [Hungatella hathewayi]
MNPLKAELDLLAARIRRTVLYSFYHLGFGHLGGSLSISDALAVLYGGIMKIDPAAPADENRDFLVYSKGHSGPGLYAALAVKGYFPMELLETMNMPGTTIPSHCNRLLTPGVDMTTGSLGQGVSLAMGMAAGCKVQNRNNRVYLITGDGECQEGQVWEAAMFAAQHKLDNLTMLVDYNKKQLDGYLDDICSLGNLEDKFRAFGWNVFNIDGHDTMAIWRALSDCRQVKEQPSVILLNTIKAKDCSFAEGVLYNHHMTFTTEQLDEAMSVLDKKINALEILVEKEVHGHV